ncbi:MAG: glycosyltransferase family 4 protein [Candidatus Hydrothermia bacterium]
MREKPRMAIIFSSDFESWPMGGMLSFVRDAIPELEKYFEIELWGVVADKRPRDFVIIDGKSYPIFYFGKVKTRKKIIPNFIRVCIGLILNKRKILQRKYDILYFHGEPLIIAFNFSRKKKPFMVLHQHGAVCPYPRLIFLYRMMQKISVICSHLTFVSALEHDFRIYREKYFNCISRLKMRRVDNFASPKIFKMMGKSKARSILNIQGDFPIFVFASRFVPEKDPLLAIRSFKVFLESYQLQNSLLILAGSGPLLGECKNLAERLEISHNVKFLGPIPREDLVVYINASNALLHTSRQEGIPLTLIEAFLCGTPVVAADAPGVNGLVIDGFNGFLVRERTPEAFADKLYNTIIQEGYLRDNVLKIREKYTPERVIEQIAKIILENAKSHFGNY